MSGHKNGPLIKRLFLYGILCLLMVCTWKKPTEKGVKTAGGAAAEPGRITEEISTSDNADGMPENAPRVCLTFDDGPHPSYTVQLLDGLQKRGVKASFFVTGEHAALHPDIILRMSEEGHVVGNHTYSHVQLTKVNRELYKEELCNTSELLQEITGNEIIYVRPPYGSWDKKLEKELNMLPVFWSIDPLDWCSTDASCIASHVLARAKDGSIILLHDYYESSVTAALQIVDKLCERGFLFVTVEEMLLD